MKTAKPIPDGRQALTPYLIVRNAAKAIEFYENAFGAKEVFRLTEPQGKIGHAELRIGDSLLMLADEYPDSARSARRRSGDRRSPSICTSRTSIESWRARLRRARRFSVRSRTSSTATGRE